ncbi:MAG TPA: bile acid:sodium symporter, partial [Spirochaetota bacterium]|nr:bile acid:sodium symporter [Spirochaetota bacterium]
MRKYFILFLLSSIVLGIVFPFGEKIKFILPYLLSTLLFFNFLDIDFKLKDVFKIELIYSFVAGTLIFPLLLFFFTLNLDTNFRIGLFLIAITPTAIGSSIIVKLIGGRVDLSIVITVINNFLSIVSYPIMLKIFFNNKTTKVDFFNIFINL